MLRRMLGCIALSSITALAQTPFKLTGVIPQRSPNVALNVNYQGTFPVATGAPYKNPIFWRVWFTPIGADKATEVDVVGVTIAEDAQGRALHKLVLTLRGSVPGPQNAMTSGWRAQFSPDKSFGIEGNQWDFTVNQTPQASPIGVKPAAKSCDNKPPDAVPYLCPTPSGGSPDLSFSGTFTSAGGSKPLYQFELLGGLYAHKDLGDALARFRPGFTTKTEINQNSSTPNSRTTFDPDSVTAGFAFQRLRYFRNAPFDLYGIQFDETLPGGEFTRKDPTSNIVVSSSAQFILRPFSQRGSLLYGTLYPLIGVEVGHNLNKPRMMDSVAVDLSNYNAIVRGVGGANATFARKSKDYKSDVWSVTASYLVRLPATNEPLVKTIHEVTTVQLTDRARHWIEVDSNISPWSFKYLAITAKYQYGELPPAFKFVNNSFSIGLTLKAIQSNKPNASGPPLAVTFPANP